VRVPLACETFLDSRLTDGGEVVILTRRLLFTHRNILLRLSRPQDHSPAGGIKQIETIQ
jgi:hypothetical protein